MQSTRSTGTINRQIHFASHKRLDRDESKRVKSSQVKSSQVKSSETKPFRALPSHDISWSSRVSDNSFLLFFSHDIFEYGTSGQAKLRHAMPCHVMLSRATRSNIDIAGWVCAIKKLSLYLCMISSSVQLAQKGKPQVASVDLAGMFRLSWQNQRRAKSQYVPDEKVRRRMPAQKQTKRDKRLPKKAT